MTRKEALHSAISQLADRPENQEIIEVLQGLFDDIPYHGWSDGTIHDSVKQFILDNGRIPTVTDFKKKELPPHPVIKNRYGITVKEWLNENYPVIKPSREEIINKCTDDFIEDYYRIKPRSQEVFNENKRTTTKGWKTIASYHGKKSWRSLLKALDLPLYFDMKKDHTSKISAVNIYTHYDFTD